MSDRDLQTKLNQAIALLHEVRAEFGDRERDQAKIKEAIRRVDEASDFMRSVTKEESVI